MGFTTNDSVLAAALRYGRLNAVAVAVMGYEGADWLERPTREEEERPDLLVKELHLTAGMTVADIGAGSGYLSKRMAAMVFPGKVLAVDVQPQMVEMLRALSGQTTTHNCGAGAHTRSVG